MTPRMVLVRWRDACHSQDEFAISDLGGLAELAEVGWLIAETPESVTLSMEHQEGATSTRLWLTIPLVNIQSIEELRLKPKRKKT